VGYEPGELGVDLVKLHGEELDAPRDPARDVGGAVGAAPQSRDRTHQVRPGHGAETTTQIIGRGHDHRVQLVERGCTRPVRAAPLEQKHPQLLSLASAARHAEALAGDDSPRRQGRVDQIILTTTPLTTPGPLTLKHHLAMIGQEAGQAGAVAATPLDPKRRLAQRASPPQTLLIPSARCIDGDRVDQPAKRIERHRHVPLLVRIHPDCHRPPSHVASPHRLATGLDRAVSGKARKLLSGHQPVNTTRRRETGRNQGKRHRQHGCGSSRRRVALSTPPRTEQAPSDATQLGWAGKRP
jgi:hypothetical protein